MSNSTANFGFIKIIVNDMDRAVDFYGRVFGLKVVRNVDSPKLAERLMASPGAEAGPFVVLYLDKEGRKITIGNGWGPAGFFVSDVDATYARALSLGGKPSRPPFDYETIRVAYFTDPEDHEIEIVSGLL